MDFNLTTNLKTCYDAIQNAVPLSMVYYSHIPSAIVSLLIGTFIILKSRKIANVIVFFISIFFSLWSFSDVVLWTSTNSESYMFFLSIITIFEVILFLLNIYLIKVYSNGKDIDLWNKIVWLLLLLPIFILVPTRLSNDYFSAVNCFPEGGILYNYYVLPLYGILLIWFLVVIFFKIKEASENNKKQIKLLSSSSFLFLLLLLVSNIVAEYLISNNLMSIENSYKIEMYGLFIMPVFLAILAYIIVKFKAFDIKMLAAEALVGGLVILVGAEFFFIDMANTGSVILLSVTVLLAILFGIWLINSVRNEVKRKEELQLMSDQLSVANDKLKKLDNAKSEFISIASHQLRTPLTSIKGYISLITEGTYGAVSAEVKDALARVYLSNERLIKLVENLLNVSRIESGRMEYTWEQGQVEGIIQGLLDDFVFAAKKNGLYLEAKMPKESLPAVRMDRAKLTEVISNTIDNAIKYTKKGGVTVLAELVNSNEQKNSIRITVSDTGIGIPAENMSEMFQKFSRGKDTTRLHATGTGLGMFVAKNIMEAHHGQIRVESDGEGLGSRFIIELPVE